jgi:hypothetical protein
MPDQLRGAYGLCDEASDSLPPELKRKLFYAVFGVHPLEFLGRVANRTAPNAHHLHDNTAVYRDSNGLLYFPHRDSASDYSEYKYDHLFLVRNPPQLADTWVCKKPEGAVHSYRIGQVAQDAVQFPTSATELLLQPLLTRDETFVVGVQSILELHAGCCVLKLDASLSTEQNHVADEKAVYSAITTALDQL